MTTDDDNLTVGSAIDEVDMLVFRYGVIGGSYRFLRAHTSRWSWVRMAMTVAAYGLIWAGYRQVELVGPYGLEITTLGVWEAHVWALFTASAMYATWKGVGYLVD